jgi:hypothetical protein
MHHRFNAFWKPILVGLLANNGLVTPSHLGVTRGDHISWPTMKIMNPIMMINILKGNNPSALQMPQSSSAQLVTLDQHGSLEEGGPTHYEVH